MNMLKTVDLFDLSHTKAAELLKKTIYPWADVLQAFLFPHTKIFK